MKPSKKSRREVLAWQPQVSVDTPPEFDLRDGSYMRESVVHAQMAGMCAAVPHDLDETSNLIDAHRLVSMLSPVEALVVSSLSGVHVFDTVDKDVGSLALDLDVSHSRVRQIYANATAKLRTILFFEDRATELRKIPATTDYVWSTLRPWSRRFALRWVNHRDAYACVMHSAPRVLVALVWPREEQYSWLVVPRTGRISVGEASSRVQAVHAADRVHEHYGLW